MKSFQQFMKENEQDDAVDRVEKEKLNALVSRKEKDQKKEEDQEDAETKQDGQLNKQEIEILKKRVKNLEDNS
tara:strand:- start:2124 stop:2342 length:219 start_codon:yes stop_codon:yes gene_type:complete